MDYTADISGCLHALRQGGLILYPTDTVWGIGCDATDPKAVERVYQLKGRAPHKSLIVLLTEERDILQYVSQVDPRVFPYLRTVQKPTTVIYEGAIHLADNLIGEDGSVGIRLVRDPFCREIIKRLRKPLVSTSANRSGEPAPAIFTDIDPMIISGVDYVVHYRREVTERQAPSAVVRLGKDGVVNIIRP